MVDAIEAPTVALQQPFVAVDLTPAADDAADTIVISDGEDDAQNDDVVVIDEAPPALQPIEQIYQALGGENQAPVVRIRQGPLFLFVILM